VLCARDKIHNPFVVINADDYYGHDALACAYDFLDHNTEDHCIVTYELHNTLSQYGTVSRGVCETYNGTLTKITEYTKVGWQ
jgi:hypothetical protein